MDREIAVGKKICGFTMNSPIIPLDLHEILERKKREEEEKKAKC